MKSFKHLKAISLLVFTLSLWANLSAHAQSINQAKKVYAKLHDVLTQNPNYIRPDLFEKKLSKALQRFEKIANSPDSAVQLMHHLGMSQYYQNSFLHDNINKKKALVEAKKTQRIYQALTYNPKYYKRLNWLNKRLSIDSSFIVQTLQNSYQSTRSPHLSYLSDTIQRMTQEQIELGFYSKEYSDSLQQYIQQLQYIIDQQEQDTLISLFLNRFYAGKSNAIVGNCVQYKQRTHEAGMLYDTLLTQNQWDVLEITYAISANRLTNERGYAGESFCYQIARHRKCSFFSRVHNVDTWLNHRYFKSSTQLTQSLLDTICNCEQDQFVQDFLKNFLQARIYFKQGQCRDYLFYMERAFPTLYNATELNDRKEFITNDYHLARKDIIGFRDNAQESCEKIMGNCGMSLAEFDGLFYSKKPDNLIKLIAAVDYKIKTTKPLLKEYLNTAIKARKALLEGDCHISLNHIESALKKYDKRETCNYISTLQLDSMRKEAVKKCTEKSLFYSIPISELPIYLHRDLSEDKRPIIYLIQIDKTPTTYRDLLDYYQISTLQARVIFRYLKEYNIAFLSGSNDDLEKLSKEQALWKYKQQHKDLGEIKLNQAIESKYFLLPNFAALGLAKINDKRAPKPGKPLKNKVNITTDHDR